MNKLKEYYLSKFSIATEILKSKIISRPKIAIIAGSGVGDALADITVKETLDYSQINQLPQITVAGHSGKIVIAEIENQEVMIFFGRFHLYEGKSIEDTLSLIFLSYCFGIENIILTNAAGGLNPLFSCADIMLIDDTINFTKFRIFDFFDFSNDKNIDKVFSTSNWSIKTKKLLTDNKTAYQNGTYLMVSGANYETKAEIRMMRILGADAVGMSTVLEMQAATILGLNVIACSVITNVAKEVHTSAVSHSEVLYVAEIAKNKILKFIECAVKGVG